MSNTIKFIIKLLTRIILIIFSFTGYGQADSLFKGEICYSIQTNYISTGEQPIPPALLLLSEPRTKCFLFDGSDTIISFTIANYDTLNISKHADGFHETYFTKKGVVVDFSALGKQPRAKSKIETIERKVTYKNYSGDKVLIKRPSGDTTYAIIANDLSLNIDYQDAKAAGLFISEQGLILFSSTYSKITDGFYLEQKTELISINENIASNHVVFFAAGPLELYKPMEKAEKNTVPIPVELRESFKFLGYDKYKETVDFDIFKGSYSYVAIWASWCEPCLRSIAFLSDLNSDYDYEQINIISLSVDKEKDFKKWLKKSKEENISWDSFMVEEDMNSLSCQQLGVSSIPYYFIIDKEGKIMLENAPSPSDPKLLEVFKALLEDN